MNAPQPSCHFPQTDIAGPRFREAGDLTLDLIHRDARVDDRWLGLHPREFALLWRLAETPGERLPGPQLRAEAWRIVREPRVDGIDAHIARLRKKLVVAGLADLIGTDAGGCYFIDAPASGDLLRIDPR